MRKLLFATLLLASCVSTKSRDYEAEIARMKQDVATFKMLLESKPEPICQDTCQYE